MLALLAAYGCGSKRSSPGAGSHKLVPIGAGIDAPAGLRATVYATGLPNVATFAFDSRGRLWATAAGLSTHRNDGVYLIARPGSRPVPVIGGLDDPLGLVWRGSTLYVASVGRVTAYRGLTGTRFTSRTTILDGPVPGGENNNLVQSPSGRLVLGVTATCDHCVPKSRYSGSIVSFASNGTDLRLYAARIRAPVGLAYFPGTSDLFVSMNQPDDLGSRTTGDSLARVAPGSDWRFPVCYAQGGSACAGVPPILAVLDRHAAVGSVAILTGQLGGAVGTAVLVAEWQTARVQRVALRRVGNSYAGEVSPFLSGLRNPLALIAAPGGSLLVGDWGTGKIYRITRAPS